PFVGTRLLRNHELVTAALQYDRLARLLDYPKVNVECRTDRERRQVAEQGDLTSATGISRDRLWHRAHSQRQPIGPGTIVVDIRVGRPLQLVVRIGLKVAHPRIEIDNPIRVVRLTELDVPESARAGDVPENDFIVEGRRLRAPAARAEDRAGGLSRRYGDGIRAARPQAGEGDGWQCGGDTHDCSTSER